MLKQGSRVLITGGAGFIGSHLARSLSAQGYEVRVLDDLSTGKRERIASIDGIELLQGDVRNPAAVQRAMQDVHAVVHLAGVQPGVDPIRAQEVNLGGALHILAAARDGTVCAPGAARADRSGQQYFNRDRPRVILCGSASVYGRQTGFVLHEELTPRPMTPEAVMALAMEQYGRVYRELHNVPVISLRIFRVFGPDEDDTRADAGIVARLIRAALDGKSPIIHGDGQQTRDLVYIDNVVAAIMAALTVEELPAEPLNIASGEAVAINFLWNMVLEACGKKRLAIDPTYVQSLSWEPKHARPQIARACNALNWAPAMRLREGLVRTIQHYQALQDRDPNAWFAPREEPSARRKLGFPTVQIPTRRFGSVVTPLFGAGAEAAPNSSASPLPSRNSSASPLPARNSSASPLPSRNSSASPLPSRNSSASPLPSRNSSASPLPARDSSSSSSFAGHAPASPPHAHDWSAPPPASETDGAAHAAGAKPAAHAAMNARPAAAATPAHANGVSSNGTAPALPASARTTLDSSAAATATRVAANGTAARAAANGTPAHAAANGTAAHAAANGTAARAAANGTAAHAAANGTAAHAAANGTATRTAANGTAAHAAANGTATRAAANGAATTAHEKSAPSGGSTHARAVRPPAPPTSRPPARATAARNTPVPPAPPAPPALAPVSAASPTPRRAAAHAGAAHTADATAPPRAHARDAPRPTPPPLRPAAAARHDEVLEVSEADLLDDSQSEAETLDCVWAPVPMLPGMGG